MIYLSTALCQFSFRQARIYLCLDSPHHSRYLAQPCCDTSVKTLFPIQAAVSIVYVLTALRHLWVCSQKLVWTYSPVSIIYVHTHSCQWFMFWQPYMLILLDIPHHSRYLAQSCCDNSLKTFPSQAAVPMAYVLTGLCQWFELLKIAVFDWCLEIGANVGVGGNVMTPT